MSTFVLTPAAEGDLQQIVEYLEGESPAAIVRVLDALEGAMSLLADNPGIGHTRPDLTVQDVRFWPVFRYLVIYRVNSNALQVVRVLHASRNVKRLLSE